MQTNKAQSLIFLLLVQTIALLTYTALAIESEGANFAQVFISNISSFTWNGQFNLDFACYLMLSAIWIIWRGNNSTTSILSAIAAMVLGIVFFAPYLILLTIQAKGNIKTVLIGHR